MVTEFLMPQAGYGVLNRFVNERGFLSVIKRPNLHDASASAEKPGQLRSPGGRCVFRPRWLASFPQLAIVREISALVHALRPTFVAISVFL
jgi:hypothetical protein